MQQSDTQEIAYDDSEAVDAKEINSDIFSPTTRTRAIDLHSQMQCKKAVRTGDS